MGKHLATAAFALALTCHAYAFESASAGGENTPLASRIAYERAIWPQMRLDEALRAFESHYRAPDAADRFQLTLKSSQNLIEDLSVLSAKLSIAAKDAQARTSLSAYVFPVPLAPYKLQRWRKRLPSGVMPPQVAHQTFAVSFNGKAYVIATGHGTRGDKRYYTADKSDTAVRPATEEEARQAIPLERRPLNLPARIITLEGKLQTGELVRFQSAAVRGGELLNVLLPDVRASFYNLKRHVEVDYARTAVFILPPDWSRPTKLRLHRAAGFSGAPAIEKTPEGDAVTGHFIGHRAVEINGRKFALGIIEDYETIRAVVERFAALPAEK
jgi:hypothetical protein